MTDGLNERLNQAQRSVMDFFFPRHCPFCGAMVGKELLCQKCERALPTTGEQAVRTGPGFGRCASPLFYEGTIREAILRYKFKGDMGGLSYFGAAMAQCAAEEFNGEFDVVTWVPVSKKRLRKRGIDQSRMLAASLCVDWHTMPIQTLEKTVDNPPQSGLEDAAARRANVLGVYRAVQPEQFKGKRLLLVDDILTTGATLGECVRVLKEAGAADVVCLTLARTKEDT